MTFVSRSHAERTYRKNNMGEGQLFYVRPRRGWTKNIYDVFWARLDK